MIIPHETFMITISHIAGVQEFRQLTEDLLFTDATHPAHDMVEKTLASVGFTPEMQSSPVASLSGGWKMKLALGTHPHHTAL